MNERNIAGLELGLVKWKYEGLGEVGEEERRWEGEGVIINKEKN